MQNQGNYFLALIHQSIQDTNIPIQNMVILLLGLGFLPNKQLLQYRE